MGREPFHVYTISHPTLQSAKRRRAKGKRAKVKGGRKGKKEKGKKRRQMAPDGMKSIHQMMKDVVRAGRHQDLVSGQRVVGFYSPFCHSVNWYNLVRCELSILFCQEEESKMSAELSRVY